MTTGRPITSFASWDSPAVGVNGARALPRAVSIVQREQPRSLAVDSAVISHAGGVGTRLQRLAEGEGRFLRIGVLADGVNLRAVVKRGRRLGRVHYLHSAWHLDGPCPWPPTHVRRRPQFALSLGYTVPSRWNEWMCQPESLCV
jgi:hypothetical protein